MVSTDRVGKLHAGDPMGHAGTNPCPDLLRVNNLPSSFYQQHVLYVIFARVIHTYVSDRRADRAAV